ncbi:PadR family transcriptional regulator [Bauldia sp.]|uniref:PadR family transcriptional regulator n=1 Tax=Bauldia sp. TaxID=2575872 RepID=UPI003BAADAA6
MSFSTLEQQIMLAALRLHPNAYGVSIQDLIADKTGKSPSFGSIYAALERLEGKGYLTSRQGEITRERGGRAKLYFTVTGQGQTTLRQALSELDNLRRDTGLAELPAT